MTTANIIAAIAEHLAAVNIDARAEFFERMDRVLTPYAVSVAVHPVERAGTLHHTPDEIEDGIESCKVTP